MLRRLLPHLRLAIPILVIGLFLLFPVIAPDSITALGTQNALKDTLTPPFTSGAHLLGTDELGRDLLIRTLLGGSQMISLSLIGCLVALAFGALAALLAAEWPHWLAPIISRITDLHLTLPSILLGLVVLSLAGSGPLQLVVVLFIVSWPLVFRTLRESLVTILGSDYVFGARLVGATRTGIAWRHVLRNALPALISTAGILFARNFLMLASLNYLGLGIQPPTPDWGLMISAGQSSISYAPWVIAVPGVAITVTVLAANALADQLRDRWLARAGIAH